MDLIPTFEEILNEDNVTSATTYFIVKTVTITKVGSTVGQRTVYRFKLRTGKYVGFIFTTGSTNTATVDFGVIDQKTWNKTGEKVYINKVDLKIFMDTKNEIFQRYIKENPMIGGIYL